MHEVVLGPRRFAGWGGWGDDVRTMFGSAMTRRLTLILICILAGCSAKPKMLLDSDVPAPPDMDNRLTDDIRRRGGELVSAKAVYAGMIVDASGRLAEISNRFRDSGWMISRSSGDGVSAVGIYAKGDRRCRVRVSKNELAPSMSRTSYFIWTETESGMVDGGAAGG